MSRYENIEELLQRSNPVPSSQDRDPDYIDDDIMFISKFEKLPAVYSTKVYANIIIFCHRGHMAVHVNGLPYDINEGDTLACPSSSVVDNMMVSPDFQFTVVAFTDKMIHELLSTNMDIWNKAMYIRKAHKVSPRSEEEREGARLGGWHFMELLRLLLNNERLMFRREIIHSLCQAVLLAYCSRHREEEIEATPGADDMARPLQSNTIFNNFLNLIRGETKKHQPVSYYAEQLCITPKHLTFVCNQVSGKPATEIIQAAVTEEIVQYLRDPRYTVKEIAERMGFANISFFGKFVKKRLGLSPNDYRKKMC